MRQHGFIHILPLLLLTVFSLTTFVIVREVEKQTQVADTRSQAAKPKTTPKPTETEAEARARRRANGEAEKKQKDTDKQASRESRKNCVFWCGGCGTGFCGDSKAVEEDGKLRLTVSCESQAWSKCGGSKCTTWCAGCGGFCGDSGSGGCNAQAQKLCGQKPCYETGTCVTASTATPTEAPSCTQPHGTKLANGTYCCNSQISQKSCGALVITPVAQLTAGPGLTENLAAFQNCVNSGVDATTCRNQVYGTTTTPTQPNPDSKLTADAARLTLLACTYLPQDEQQACQQQVRNRMPTAAPRDASTLLPDGDTCGFGGRSCADCRSRSSYKLGNRLVCGKPTVRTTPQAPHTTTPAQATGATEGRTQITHCGTVRDPRKCSDVCESGTYREGFGGYATCVLKGTELTTGEPGAQAASAPLDSVQNEPLADAGTTTAPAAPVPPVGPTPTIATSGLKCSDIYNRGECVRAGSNRWVRCTEEDGRKYPVLRDDPTCAPFVSYTVNRDGQDVSVPVQLGTEPPGFNDYITCQNNALAGIGCSTGESYGQCSSGPGGNTYTCICDPARGYRHPVLTKVKDRSECGKVPDAVAVAMAQYQATQRPASGWDTVLPDGKKDACGKRDEWERWVDGGSCKTCRVTEDGRGVIVTEPLIAGAGVYVSTESGKSFSFGSEHTIRANAASQCGPVLATNPRSGSLSVRYFSDYTLTLPGPGGSGTVTLTPDRPVCTVDGCVAGRIENGKLVKIPVTVTGEGSAYAFACPSECTVVGKDSGSFTTGEGSVYATSVYKCSANGSSVEVYQGIGATKPRSVTACASGVCSGGTCVEGKLVVDASLGTTRICGVGETCKTVDPYTGLQVTQTVKESTKDGETVYEMQNIWTSESERQQFEAAQEEAIETYVRENTSEKYQTAWHTYKSHNPEASFDEFLALQHDALETLLPKMQNLGMDTQEFVQKVQAGQIVATDALAGLEATVDQSLTARIILGFNNLTAGATYRGNQLLTDPDSSWWDKTRGAVMQGAAPAAVAVLPAALVAAPLAGAIAGTAVAISGVSSAVAIVGTTIGVSGTVWSLQNTAEQCTLSGHMTAQEKWRCTVASANTAFSAGATYVGALSGGVSLLDDAARAAQKGVATANTASQLGSAIPGALEAQSNALVAAQTSANLVKLNKGVSLAGTVIFGAQAVDECAKVVQGKPDARTDACLWNAAFAGVSAARFITGNVRSANVQRSVGGLDLGVNLADAAATCAPLAVGQGQGDIAGCMQKAAGALVQTGGEVVGWRATNVEYHNTAAAQIDVAMQAKLALYDADGNLRSGATQQQVDTVNTNLERAIQAASNDLAQVQLARDLVPTADPTVVQIKLRDALASLDTIPPYRPGEDQALSVRRQNAINEVVNFQQLAAAEQALLTPPKRGVIGQVQDAIALRMRRGSDDVAPLIAYQDAVEEFRAIAGDPDKAGTPAYTDAYDALLAAQKTLERSRYYNSRQLALQDEIDTLQERVSDIDSRAQEQIRDLALLSDKPKLEAELVKVRSDLESAQTAKTLLGDGDVNFDPSTGRWKDSNDTDLNPPSGPRDGFAISYTDSRNERGEVIWKDQTGNVVGEEVVRDAAKLEFDRLREKATAHVEEIHQRVATLNDMLAMHSDSDTLKAAVSQRRAQIRALQLEAGSIQQEIAAYAVARNTAGTLADRVKAVFGRGATVETVKAALARSLAPKAESGSVQSRRPEQARTGSLRQRLLGTGDNPTGLGRLVERFGFSVEPASKFPFADIAISARRLAAEGKKFSVILDSQGKFRLQYPEGASRRLRSQIDALNTLFIEFGSTAGLTPRPDQVSLLVAPEAILGLQAGGGKTSVIGPLLAAMERTTVKALPTSSDAISYVNDIVAKKPFFDKLGIKIYFYDEARGFLEVGPQFDRANATVVDPATVRSAADAAAQDPSTHGLMIITESADNAWAQIGGKHGDTSASTLMHEMVMGAYDYMLIYDEIGAVAGGNFSKPRGEPVTLASLTDAKNLQGLADSSEMLTLSAAVKDSQSVTDFRKQVLAKLEQGASAEEYFFSYIDSAGRRVVKPYPKDASVIGKTYADLIDIALNGTTDLSGSPIAAELISLRDNLRKTPESEPLRLEYESVLKRTVGLTDADRAILTQIAYMTSDVQARWFVLSRVPENDFGYETPKTQAERQLEANLAQARKDVENATDQAAKQTLQKKVIELEIQLEAEIQNRQGDLVLRKSGGTTGEQYSQVVQKLALHTEGVEMLKLAGLPVDENKLPTTERITITPDSDQITNVEIMRYKASRGKLKGYDGTPDSATNALGIDATAKSEIPPKPAGYVQNHDVLELIKTGAASAEYQAYIKGETPAFILADKSVAFSKQTDAIAVNHPDVDFVARTKFITEPDGGVRTEYFIEQVVRDSDRNFVRRKTDTIFATADEWSAAIHAKLAELGPSARGKLAIVYEGRTRAVDFKVEANNKDIRWTVIASDQNTVEDITQSWKRNRVAAQEAGLLANGWTQEEIDTAKQYHLWVRTEQDFTKDTIVGHFQSVHAEQLATVRFEAAIAGIAKAPERALVSARDSLLATASENQKPAIRASFERLIADAQRVERATFAEIQTKPLTGADIATEIYNRGQAAHAQLEATIASLRQQFALTDSVVTSLQKTFGVDTPYMSRAAFDELFNAQALSKPTNQNPTGPAAFARYWAEMNSPDTIPKAAWSNKTEPDVFRVAAQTQEQVSQAVSAGRLQAEHETAQQRVDQAAALASQYQNAVEQGTYTSNTLTPQSRSQLWRGWDALTIAVGQAFSALERAREELKNQTAATQTRTYGRILRFLQKGDVLTRVPGGQRVTVENQDQRIVRYPRSGGKGSVSTVGQTQIDTENYSYVLVPTTYEGNLSHKQDIVNGGGFELVPGEQFTTTRIYQSENAAHQALLEEINRLQAAYDAVRSEQIQVGGVVLAEIASHIKDATGVSLSVNELSSLPNLDQTMAPIAHYLAAVHHAAANAQAVPVADQTVVTAVVEILGAINAGRDIENQILTSEAYALEILEKIRGPVVAAAQAAAPPQESPSPAVPQSGTPGGDQEAPAAPAPPAPEAPAQPVDQPPAAQQGGQPEPVVKPPASQEPPASPADQASEAIPASLEPDDTQSPKLDLATQLWRGFWQTLDPRGSAWFVAAGDIVRLSMQTLSWRSYQISLVPLRYVATAVQKLTDIPRRIAVRIPTISGRFADRVAQWRLDAVYTMGSLQANIWTGWLFGQEDSGQVRNIVRQIRTLDQARRRGQARVNELVVSAATDDVAALLDKDSSGKLIEIGRARAAVLLLERQIVQLKTQLGQTVGGSLLLYAVDTLAKIPLYIDAPVTALQQGTASVASYGRSVADAMDAWESDVLQEVETRRDGLEAARLALRSAERPGFAGGFDALWSVVVDPYHIERRQLRALQRIAARLGIERTELEKEQRQYQEDLQNVQADIAAHVQEAEQIAARLALVQQATEINITRLAQLNNELDAREANNNLTEDEKLALITEIHTLLKAIQANEAGQIHEQYEQVQARLASSQEQRLLILSDLSIVGNRIARNNRNLQVNALEQGRFGDLAPRPPLGDTLDRLASFVGLSNTYRQQTATWARQLLGYYAGGLAYLQGPYTGERPGDKERMVRALKNEKDKYVKNFQAAFLKFWWEKLKELDNQLFVRHADYRQLPEGTGGPAVYAREALVGFEKELKQATTEKDRAKIFARFLKRTGHTTVENGTRTHASLIDRINQLINTIAQSDMGEEEKTTLTNVILSTFTEFLAMDIVIDTMSQHDERIAFENEVRTQLRRIFTNEGDSVFLEFLSIYNNNKLKTNSWFLALLVLRLHETLWSEDLRQAIQEFERSMKSDLYNAMETEEKITKINELIILIKKAVLELEQGKDVTTNAAGIQKVLGCLFSRWPGVKSAYAQGLESADGGVDEGSACPW